LSQVSKSRNRANKFIAASGKPSSMKPIGLSREECESLLSRGRYGRLGLCGDHPYVVPMSYVFADGCIFLHSGPGGRKVQMAMSNPNICFEVDELCGQQWRSVIVTGQAKLSDSSESKDRMFRIFSERGMGGHGGQVPSREMLAKIPMVIWEIPVQEISGREGAW